MSTKKDKPEEPEQKRLADEIGGKAFEGEKIKLSEIEGQEVILVDFKFGQSKYHEGREFTMMQLEVDGELKHASNGSGVLVDLFHRIEKLGKDEKLPAPVVFQKVQSAEGRTYWTIK